MGTASPTQCPKTPILKSTSDIQTNIKRACELGLDAEVFEIVHFQEFADRKSPVALVLAEGSKSAGSPAPFPVTAQVFQLFHEDWKHLGNAKAGSLHLSNFSKIVQMILRDFNRIFSLLCTGN